MKLLAMLLLSANLSFASSDVESVGTSETPTVEVSDVGSEDENGVDLGETSEETTEQDQTVFQQLLEQWLNGEIELDDITLQKIYNKLGTISQEDIDVMLEKYIEDAEEREKISTIIYAVLTAVLCAMVVAIFLNRIKKQGIAATINNETFSKSSVVMKETVSKLKDDFDRLYNVVKDNSEKTDKFVEVVKEASKLTEDQLKGIIGVLKIHYQGVDENEQSKDS